MTPQPQPQHIISMYQWIRPNGERRLREYIVTPEAQQAFEAGSAAGFVYSVEDVMPGAWALYITHDNVDQDLVTHVMTLDDTSAGNIGKLSGAICKYGVDMLNELLDKAREDEGQTAPMPAHAAMITNFEAWGFIPDMLNIDSDMPLWQQVHQGYAHGGGWNDFKGFDVGLDDNDMYTITYPGDPTYHERGRIERAADKLVIFDYSWVLWTNGTEHKIARID